MFYWMSWSQKGDFHTALTQRYHLHKDLFLRAWRALCVPHNPAALSLRDKDTHTQLNSSNTEYINIWMYYILD